MDKKPIKLPIILGVAVSLLGGIFLNAFFLLRDNVDTPSPTPSPTPTPSLTPPPTPEPVWTSERDDSVIITVLLDDEIIPMTMTDYLWGVVTAEMPASFEEEALKAQGVTARTYTYYKTSTTSPRHPDAQICGDHTCCQAFTTLEKAQIKWEEDTPYYTKKIRNALAQTDGQVILYQNVPIQALFFSSAAGMTQDSVAVWGNQIPYLTSVESPEGNEVPNYQTTVAVAREEFQTLILSAYPKAQFPLPLQEDDPDDEPNNESLPDPPPVSTWLDGQMIGGVETNPVTIRSLFGLRSATFTIGYDEKQDEILFDVTGYGHGVGMSQYGANAMAKSGSTYLDILTHYYTDIDIGYPPGSEGDL